MASLGGLAGALGCMLWLAAGAAAAQAPAPSPRPDAGPLVLDVPVDADAPSVSAAAERGEALLGAPFTVFVTARAQAGVTASLREPVELGPAFEVRRKLASVRARGDGGRDYEWQLEVVAWEVGELTLPPIALVFEVRGQAGSISTARAPVRIIGTLAEDSVAPRELAPPRELARQVPLWPYLGAAALLALLVGAVWWRRRSRAPGALATVGSVHRRGPSAGVFERARQRLDELERSGALTSRQKEAYAELAAVVYELVGALGAFAVADLTSGELVQKMALRPSVAGGAAAVARWLAAIDRVRYDAYVADPAQTQAALAQARALVALLGARPPAAASSAAAPSAEAAPAPSAEAAPARDAADRPAAGQAER